MSDESSLRLRLQQVAAYRELCRSVRRGGRENVVFAMVMFGLAYFLHSEKVAPPFLILVYAGLGVGELLVGLFKWAFPSAEGLILDALVLLAFAVLNFGRELIAMQAGRPVSTTGVFFGFLLLYFAFGRVRHYGVLRRLFAERPSPEHVAWFDDLVHEIRASDPHSDGLALDLPTTPHWRAKLLGTTAFFVAARGNAVWVAGADEFALKREKTERGTGFRRAYLEVHGEAYPEFEIDDASWANYTKWREAQAGDSAGDPR